MIDTAIEMLFAEVPGEEVVAYVRRTFVDSDRAAENRERTLASLSSTMTEIRNAIVSSGRRAHSYDPTPLAAHANGNDEIATFLAAPLVEQLSLQRAHAAGGDDASWSPEAERCLRELQLLPKSMEEGFRLTPEQCLQLRSEREAAVMRKNESLIVVPDTDLLLTTLEQLLAEASPTQPNARLILPLLLASGRRLTEICSPRSTFKSLAGRPTLCQFDGALKKRGTAKTGGQIPLLCSYAAFSHALAAFRGRQQAETADKRRASTSVEDLSNLQIKSRYGRGVNLALEKGQVLPLPTYECVRTRQSRRCHAHDLRAIYAKACYKLYHCSENFARTTCRVLLHESLTESLSYAHTRLLGLDGSKIGSFGPIV